MQVGAIKHVKRPGLGDKEKNFFRQRQRVIYPASRGFASRRCCERIPCLCFLSYLFSSLPCGNGVCAYKIFNGARTFHQHITRLPRTLVVCPLRNTIPMVPVIMLRPSRLSRIKRVLLSERLTSWFRTQSCSLFPSTSSNGVELFRNYAKLNEALLSILELMPWLLD